MQDNEDEQAQQAQGAAQQQGQSAIIPVSGAQGSTIAPTPASPVTPQQRGSGRFTNIQKYVQANQGAGQRMAGDIGKQVGKSQQQLAGTLEQTGGFNKSIQQERDRIAGASNIVSQIQSLVGPEQQQQQVKDVSAFRVGGFTPESAGRPQGEPQAAQPVQPNAAEQLLKQQDEIARLRTGQTQAGDIEQKSQDLFGKAQQQLGQVGQLAEFAKTEPGRFELLRQTYARPTYSSGQRRLDQVLLQNTGGGKVLGELQKGLGQQVKQSGEQLKSSQAEVGSGLADIQDRAASAKGRISDALAGETGQLQSNLETRRQQQLANLQGIEAQAKQKLANKEVLDPNYFTQLGLSPEDSKKAYENYEAVRTFAQPQIAKAEQEVNKRVDAVSNQMPALFQQLLKYDRALSVDDATANLNKIKAQLNVPRSGRFSGEEGEELRRQEQVAIAALGNAKQANSLWEKVNALAVDTAGVGFGKDQALGRSINDLVRFKDIILPKVTTAYRNQLSDLQNRRNEVVGGVDFSQFVRNTTPDNLTLQNVASDQDYANYAALSKLAGTNPTLLTEQDRAKAGTGQDAARSRFDQQRANESIKALLAERAKEQGIEMPQGGGEFGIKDFADLATRMQLGVTTGGLSEVLPSLGVQLPSFSWSDKSLKKDVKKLDSKEIKDMLDNIAAFSYKYKNSKHGEGKRTGVMAQDLKKSKAGSDMVVKKEEGMAIDNNKAISTLLAAVSDMHNRMKKIEGKR